MKKIRSPKYLKFISTKPCLICGLNDDTISAHHLLRAGGKGMGVKACDTKTIPLCFDCHQGLHLHGDEIDYLEYHSLPYDEVLELVEEFINEAFDKGILKAS